jgi:H+/Cl- antiporter ClcA
MEDKHLEEARRSFVYAFFVLLGIIIGFFGYMWICYLHHGQI